MRNASGLAFMLAAAAFGVSAVVFGATAVDAVRIEDSSDPGVSADSPAGEAAGEVAPEESRSGSGPDPVDERVSPDRIQGNSYPRVSHDELLGAINQDLFQPDRTPSIERYLLPSERVAPVRDARNDRRRREPSLRIVGTAIAGDRALAIVQPEDSIPFAVLLGEVVDGYTLAAITEEFVTLVGGDGEFIYPVVEPDRGRSSNRDGNARSRADTEAAARALTERAQEIMRGLQRSQMMRGGGGEVRQLMPFEGMPISTGVRLVPARGGRSGGGGGSGGEAEEGVGRGFDDGKEDLP